MTEKRSRCLRYIRPVYHVLDTLRNVLIIVIFSFIILAGALAIFLRYMPNLRGLPWTDEVLRYLNIWVVFLGASIAVKQGNHLRVDFFLRHLLPERFIKVVQKFVLIAIVVCLLVLIHASVYKFLSSLHVVIQAAPISIAVFYLAIPVGCALMLLDYLLILIFGEHPFIPRKPVPPAER